MVPASKLNHHDMPCMLPPQPWKLTTAGMGEAGLYLAGTTTM